VFYLPDVAAQERLTARLAAAGVHPVVQTDYWEANGVTYQDPDGREVVFVLRPAEIILIRAPKAHEYTLMPRSALSCRCERVG